MGRKYYSSYIEHHMRFHARFEKPVFFSSDADERSWYACQYVLDELSEKDREMILTIYREVGTIPDNVYNLAEKQGISEGRIWKILGDFENKVATKRGLI